MSFRVHSLYIGPLIAFFAAWAGALFMGFSAHEAGTFGITLWTVFWWVTEAVPLPIASLLPIIFFPVLGILSPQEAAAAFGSPLNFMLLAGMMLSATMEKSKAHRQIALSLVGKIGNGEPRKVILGFMIAAAALSMWISNTATAIMLLPIALAVIAQTSQKAFATALLLGLAYACNIGGIGTPIGTLPNIIFKGLYEQFTGVEYSFFSWMKVAVPIVVVFIPLTWLILVRGVNDDEKIDLPPAGKWTGEQKRVLAIFAFIVFLWVTKDVWKPYLAQWTGGGNFHDSTIALIGVILFFIIPTGRGEEARLLDWETAKKVPWGILLLVGGGLSIAKALEVSGLTEVLGTALSNVADFPLPIIVLILCIFTTFLTEFTSNTAISTILLPIIASIALTNNLPVALLMLPVAFSASCAFMLPAATFPNAVVMSAERFKVITMVRKGFWVNLIGIVLITVFTLLLVGPDK